MIRIRIEYEVVGIPLPVAHVVVMVRRHLEEVPADVEPVAPAAAAARFAKGQWAHRTGHAPTDDRDGSADHCVPCRALSNGHPARERAAHLDAPADPGKSAVALPVAAAEAVRPDSDRRDPVGQALVDLDYGQVDAHLCSIPNGVFSAPDASLQDT